MAKRYVITDGKLPERVCPVCGTQVLKVVIYGQLSYECTQPLGAHWGPWDESVKDPLASMSGQWKT